MIIVTNSIKRRLQIDAIDFLKYEILDPRNRNVAKAKVEFL